MKNRMCELFGIEFPIFAFSHCRDVVAAVSKAGGFGVLGAITFTPEEFEIELNWIDENINGKPYGVDIVMPAKTFDRDMGFDDPKTLARELEHYIDEEHRSFVERILAEHKVPPLPPEVEQPAGALAQGLLGWTAATGAPLVEIALAHPIQLLANALGPPPRRVVDQAHAVGVRVAALVGSAHQALRQQMSGVDIVIAQGQEAGGHTGEISSLVLWPEVVEAVAPMPVLAAGGIGSGKQMAAAMALGVDGVWTGSIWLTVAEADTSPLVLDKLLAATSHDTVRSRALTGKPARILRSAWTDAWETSESPGTLPMPLQFLLQRDVMPRATRAGAKDLLTMPVGQIVGRMNTVRSAKDVLLAMVEEHIDTCDRMSAALIQD